MVQFASWHFTEFFFPKCNPWTQGKRSFRLTFEKCSKSALKKAFTTRFKNVFVGVLRQNRKTKACFAMFCLLDRWSYFNFSFSKCWINPQEKMCFLSDLKRKRSHIFLCKKHLVGWTNGAEFNLCFFWFPFHRVFFCSPGKKGHVLSWRKIQHGKGEFF